MLTMKFVLAAILNRSRYDNIVITLTCDLRVCLC